MNIHSASLSAEPNEKATSTKDKDRDETLLGADFFAADKFPTAHYVAEKFADQGGGKYTANGKLTLRNVTKDVPVAFTYETKDGTSWLKGSAKLARLDKLASVRGTRRGKRLALRP